MKNAIHWLLRSSADPQKVAATVKGAAKVAAAYVLQLALASCTIGFYCLGVDATWFNQGIDLLGTLVMGVLYVVGALQGMYGLYRKATFARWAAPLR